MKTKLCIILLLLFLPACSKSVPDLVVRTEQAPTTVAVSIYDDGGFQEGLKAQIVAKVRQDLLYTKVGIPVVDNKPAQLLLTIKIIDWPYGLPKVFSWKLVDHTGSILTSGIERDNKAGNGFSVRKVSAAVLNSISNVDTNSFASNPSVLFPETIIVDVESTEVTKTKTSHVYPNSKTAGENSFAIIVGVENYRDEIQPALYSTNDAMNIESLFSKTLNIPQKNIKLLLNNRASKTDILIALSDWLAKKETKGGNVFFYFSGHGSPKVDSGDAYILPYDANPTYLKSAGISVEEIQSLLKRTYSKNTYIILDSCFSGNGGRSILAKGTRPLVPVKALEANDAILFSASDTNQTTGIHGEQENGLFTYYFIRGLSGEADENKDASVSIPELKTFVYENVSKAAKQQNREQHPLLLAPTETKLTSHYWVKELGGKKTR